MRARTRVKVVVPASTSNLGPGFDCLGMALGLYNELVLEIFPEDGPSFMEIKGEGAGVLPTDETNLIIRSAREILGEKFKNRLVFKAINRIPLARGLGSSAAAVAAGLFAANHLLRHPFTAQELFERAVFLEGHPDNAAPAIFGGVVVTLKERAAVRRFNLKPHPDLAAVACIPDFELSTAKARAVLPRVVPLHDAVENVSRAMLLASTIERGRWPDLAAAMGDRLHHPFRARLIPGLEAAIRAAASSGAWGAALSGSGSSLIALARKGLAARAAGKAMREAFLSRGLSSRSVTLPIDRRGVHVLPRRKPS